MNVGIPGTGQSGLRLAAALGIFVESESKGLSLLDCVTPQSLKMANQYIKENRVFVQYQDGVDPLYVKAQVFRGEETASAIIINDYSNVVEVSVNQKIIYSSDAMSADETKNALKDVNVKEIIEIIEAMELDELSFLLDYAKINKEAVEVGLNNPSINLGRNIQNHTGELQTPYSVIHKAQAATAAAGESRMSGLSVPIMAISGSGNHGITSFLGVLSVAEALDVPPLKTARALAISSAITIYIKSFIRRVTAFCGCAVSASTGVAAATVYLLGGTYEQSVLAMQSVVGTLGGIFCDGAKMSCAYKLSTAASMAVQFAYLALENCGIPNKMGIVGNTIEETFYNLGILNNPGMVETDKVIIKIIENTLACSS